MNNNNNLIRSSKKQQHDSYHRGGLSDFDPRQHIAMISGIYLFFIKVTLDLDSGVDLAHRRGGGQHNMMNNNSLGVRDSDFENNNNIHFNMEGRPIEDSHLHNLSIYREAQQEMENQIRGTTTAASGSNQENKLSSDDRHAQKHLDDGKRSSTFMGSIEDEDHKETVKRFIDDDQVQQKRRQKDEFGEKRVIAAKKKKKKKSRAIEEPSEEYIEVEDKRRKTYGERPVSSYKRNNFEQFTDNFYPNVREQNQLMTMRSGMHSMRSRQGMFEPQFIQTQNYTSRQRMLMPTSHRMMPVEYPELSESWIVKITPTGYMYFHLQGTKTRQWAFPRFFDPEIKKTRPYFVDHWIKKYDNKGQKYWQNMHTKHIQHVRPDSETYLTQAAMVGNLAFIELYIKSNGNLYVSDQKKKTALHQSVSHGHREITAMLCEFCYALIETEDINGCTPVIYASKYNEVECLKLLISYDCNLFHKMRSGDTCLHTAASYNSLESMILLTNFGGMELLEQKNRYGLRAIDLARKGRNYECFEVLQNLERNLQYQNAIYEREIQSLDQMTGRSAKSSRVNYLGSGANHPMFSSRQQMSQRSHRPQQMKKSSRHQNIDDSSLIEVEEPEFSENSDASASEALESLGGKGGYKRRINEFEQKAQAEKHEKEFLAKARRDRQLKKEEYFKKQKAKENLDFDDYRKSKNLSARRRSVSITEEEDYGRRGERQYSERRGGRSARGDQGNRSERGDDTTRYLQRHLNSRFADISENTDQERGARSERRKKYDDTRQSFVEIALDKTTALAGAVKNLLVNGFSKIKNLVAQGTQRTSRDDGSESSLDRYKTPMGRSKSRALSARSKYSKVVPLDSKEVQDYLQSEQEERKRQVNFNISRVRADDQIDENPYSRPKSAQPRKQQSSILVQVEPPKSVLRNRMPSESARSVGVGSHNVNDDSIVIPTEEQQQPQQNQVERYSSNPTTNTGVNNQLKKKTTGIKMYLHKNYQSSEERGALHQANNGQKVEQDQLSQSSRASSIQQRSPTIIQQKQVQEEEKQINLIRQLAPPQYDSISQNIQTNSQPPPQQKQNTQVFKLPEKKPLKSKVGSAKPRLSQEQFEMIMLNSEQDEKVKVTQPAKLVQPPQLVEEKKNDIEKFYEDLMQNETTAPQIQQTQSKKQNEQDETNLSALYNQIMNDNQLDFKNSPAQQIKTKQVPQVIIEEEIKQQVQQEASILTEFNPPTQAMIRDKSYRVDLSFQSGISDLRRALEEEENFENVSDCTFIQGKVAQAVVTTNILDKGQFVFSQNSLHQSIGGMNSSQLQGRHQSACGPRPLALNLLTVHNNSMNFNNIGNSFTQKYQSDNEEQEHISLANKKTVNGGQKQNTMTMQVNLPSKGPQKSNAKAPVIAQTISSDQSQQPGGSSSNGGQVVVFKEPQKAGSSAHSEHTISSAGVVIMSGKLSSQEPESVPQPTQQQQQLINLFKEDTEQTSPQQAKPTIPIIDDTQTDLESGFDKKKHHDEESPQNTFEGLKSDTQRRLRIIGGEEQPSSEILGSEISGNMKENIMKRLVDIMEDDDDSITRQQQPSQMSDLIELTPVSQPFLNKNQSISSVKPSARKNTRYGDAEDSLINFDLTSSKININNEEDELSIVIQKRQSKKFPIPVGLAEGNQILRGSDSDQNKTSHIKQMLVNEIQAVPGKKKTLLLSEMEAQVMPLITLKHAFTDCQPMHGAESHQIEPQVGPQQIASSLRKILNRKYNLDKYFQQKVIQVGHSNQQFNVPTVSQDGILQDLDSISRIYNDLEIVPEEQSDSHITKKSAFNDYNKDDEEEKQSTSKKLQVPSSDQIESNQFWNPTSSSHKREGSLPPLMKVNSEDEGMEPPSRRNNRLQDMFYPKQQHTNLPDGGATPNQLDDLGDALPLSGVNNWREEKQNRSTATPLFSYNTSSDEEGNKYKYKPQKVMRLLNKYNHLHSSVAGAQPLLAQTTKNQKTIKDVSFKSHNVSNHTDTSERLKENLKMFGKNKLLGQQKK